MKTMAKLQADNNRLTQALLNQNQATTPIRDNRNPPTRTSKPKSYCWTHGYRVSKNHTSANCNRTAPGHQTAATMENNMGGNQDGKPTTSSN